MGGAWVDDEASATSATGTGFAITSDGDGLYTYGAARGDGSGNNGRSRSVDSREGKGRDVFETPEVFACSIIADETLKPCCRSKRFGTELSETLRPMFSSTSADQLGVPCAAAGGSVSAAAARFATDTAASAVVISRNPSWRSKRGSST